jgi:hypothetical protein
MVESKLIEMCIMEAKGVGHSRYSYVASAFFHLLCVLEGQPISSDRAPHGH